MARTCVLTALLEPEQAFQGIEEIWQTDFGMLRIADNRLTLVFTLEDEDAPPHEAGVGFKTAHDFLQAFLLALAWATDIGVRHKSSDYVEGFGDGRLFMGYSLPGQQAQPKVDSSAVASTEELLRVIMSDEYLQWALDDFRAALTESGASARKRGRALVYLFRCIEWLENLFGGESEARRELCISKQQWDTIASPAHNRLHTRHAKKDAQPVSPQELEDAFKNTKEILQKYMNWLHSHAGKGG